VTLDYCPLCEKHDVELQISHVIPNAIFKKVKDNGKAFEIKTADNDVIPTQKSWADKMLCRACEQVLNTQYEDQSIRALRQAAKAPRVNNCLNMPLRNTLSMAYFILSMAWRASKSKNEAYEDISFPEEFEILIAKILKKPSNEIFKLFSFRISYLCDGRGYFNKETIKNFLVKPYTESVEDRQMAVVFTFEGYRLEFILPVLSDEAKRSDGVLYPHCENLLIPKIDIFEDETLRESMLMAATVVKEAK